MAGLDTLNDAVVLSNAVVTIEGQLKQIKTTQEAILDLLKIQGLTTEAFVTAYQNVLEFRFGDIQKREEALVEKLRIAGLFTKL